MVPAQTRMFDEVGVSPRSVLTIVEEVNAAFSQALKHEIFPPPSPNSRHGSPARQTASPVGKRPVRKPMTFHNISNIPTHQVSSAGTTPLHHHPPPAMTVDRDRHGERELSPASTLPPLPLHAPSTPNSGHGRAPGAGPSGSHHRAHQSQVALTSSRVSPTHSGRKGLSPPPSASPATPTKKRLLNFHSPSVARMASLTDGLDNMTHDQYSLSPVGKASQQILLSPRKGIRQIARTPFKVLDAPELAVSDTNRRKLMVG